MLKNNLIIFLKYPEPGKVKTRLAKTIGYEKAADVYSALTKYLVSQFTGSPSYKVTVHYTPENRSEEISQWLKIDNMVLQRGNNLGEKLSFALDISLKNGFKNAVVIGTDCIELTNEDIENSFKYLSSEYDSVVGPTNDGGYYLIGLHERNYPLLFNDISWSTDRVFNQTMERIDEIGIRNKVLNYYNDIDDISDINSNVIKIINSYKPDLGITI